MDETRPAPYLLVEKTGESFRIEGLREYAVGHKIPRPDRGSGVNDGAWMEWRWDGRSLAVQTCPHGLVPVYYFARGGTIIVSTSIAELLKRGADAAWNWPGLAVMLRCGSFIGDETPFADIHALWPDAKLTWRGGSLAIERLPYRPRIRSPSRNEALEEYLGIVECAVKRRLPDSEFAMPLSSGRDSRHILLQLAELGHLPDRLFTSATYRGSTRAEIAIAGRIAAMLNVAHDVVDVRADELRAELDVMALTDFCVSEHAWSLPLAERLASYRTVYDGLNGGVLFGRVSGMGEKFELATAGKFEELAAGMLSVSEDCLRLIMTDAYYRKVSRDLALERLSRAIRDHRDAPNPVQAFYYWNRVVRSTTYYTFRILRNDTVYCPLDDIDLVDFALGLPHALTVDPKFQNDAIRKRFPRFRDVPFEEEYPADKEAGGRGSRRPLNGLLAFFAARWSSAWCRSSRIMPRALFAAATGRREMIDWWAEPAVYLSQLERFRDGLVSRGRRRRIGP